MLSERLDYLRVSVTERCNLNCIYCKPRLCTNAWRKPLTTDKLVACIARLVEGGVKRVRLTGGEPLVRPDITGLIKKIRKISPEVEDISITTNGLLLKNLIDDLKSAGLQRINISLDALDPITFKKITGADSFGAVWSAVLKAVSSGFKRIKLNTVLLKGVNDSSIFDFAELTMRYDLDVRFIEYMGRGNLQYVSSNEILGRLKERYQLEIAYYPFDGGGPAEYMKIPNAKGFLGFISPNTRNFCSRCTRLRLSADGRLFTCLFSTSYIDMIDDMNYAHDFSSLSALKDKSKCEGKTIEFCGG